MIGKLATEEELNIIINNGDPAHVSFATRTETAIDVTMVTPELNQEIEWYVHGDTCKSDHYSTICRYIESNPQTTRRPIWKLKTVECENYCSTLARALRNMDETLSIKEITEKIFESADQNIKRTSQETPQIKDKKRREGRLNEGINEHSAQTT
jgi:hypothetical protein